MMIAVPLQHQQSLKKRRKKTFFFLLFVGKLSAKAQHCLNNEKAFTDGHKSVCNDTILMNIYSHQFS